MASVTSGTIRGSEFIGKIVVPNTFPAILGVFLLLLIWTSDEVVAPYVVGISLALLGWFLAGTAWIHGRETRYKLAQARRNEKDLKAQNNLLKCRVKKRTHELRRAQIEEMQQMYRLAELGQAGVTLLHDLANYLSVLSVEVEGLQGHEQPQEVERIKKAIYYLEGVVDDTRSRLHGETRIQEFDIANRVREIIAFLRHKAIKANVVIDWHPGIEAAECCGDKARFSQVLTYIISNAVDAYEKNTHTTTHPHRVVISMEQTGDFVVIKVRDRGKGIPKKLRKDLFMPFRTTKKNGLGLGLFIAKQIVEADFAGSLTLHPSYDFTEFIIKIRLCQDMTK